MNQGDTKTILLIDDEEDILESFERILITSGHRVVTSTHPERIESLLREHSPDVVVTDLRMRRLDGHGVLESTMAEAPHIPVLIITAYGTIESAVQSVKDGAFDYLTKPIARADLIEKVRRALVQGEAQRIIVENPQMVHEKLGCAGLVGKSPTLKRTVDLLRKVARTDANVVIMGESGTGKEVVARCLHSVSHRRERPFVPIDCASIPETLLESELFGHERGAFTGAVDRKLGVFEIADGGTILLDEIGEMSLALQAKLLRVVQERTFRRVGGREEIKIDVRLISATNRDLTQECERGGFRQDLYYRLQVITVPLPPLRERQGDVALLAHHFFMEFMERADKKLDGFDEGAIACMESYAWPGNVRELQNVIERAVVLSDGPLITPVDLPGNLCGGDCAVRGCQPVPAPAAAQFHSAKQSVVSSFERDYLIEHLRRNRGNVSKASSSAGINRRTLYRLIKKFDIDLTNLRA